MRIPLRLTFGVREGGVDKDKTPPARVWGEGGVVVERKAEDSPPSHFWGEGGVVTEKRNQEPRRLAFGARARVGVTETSQDPSVWHLE